MEGRQAEFLVLHQLGQEHQLGFIGDPELGPSADPDGILIESGESFFSSSAADGMAPGEAIGAASDGGNGEPTGLPGDGEATNGGNGEPTGRAGVPLRSKASFAERIKTAARLISSIDIGFWLPRWPQADPNY